MSAADASDLGQEVPVWCGAASSRLEEICCEGMGFGGFATGIASVVIVRSSESLAPEQLCSHGTIVKYTKNSSFSLIADLRALSLRKCSS